MSWVIAGIYEVQSQIGAGGSGVVYIGRHLRLEKQVVLKADKRKLGTKPEVLRREVDMLKGLSHRYIPQVYDFVQEDGVVYTVMDFIEGESLDKILRRGQVPAQPQVIKWACQLLEALCYLHSRPPYGILHGDIKPANIMLRPDGDICLIDYNIALALGENGAVKAGYSRGYASPEHYGAETQSLRKDNLTTVTDDGDITASDGNRRHSFMLDARSDIYSLGATLYHLLSGVRPMQEASQVKPLASDICSAHVAAIVEKAMAPEPAMRYQSAEEMREAFLGLHRNDRRAVRHKRRILISAILLTLIFLTGGTCSFWGLKQLEQRQEALTLAEYSSNALGRGDVAGAVRLALQAIPEEKSLFSAPVTAQAQKALTDALGVYDLSDGFKALETITLPSAPLNITMSPEGFFFAATYAYEVKVYDIRNRKETATLPVRASALSDVIFADESHLLYAGPDGVTAYDLKEKSVVWTGEAATTLAISADGTTIAAVERTKPYAVIYRVSDGELVAECSFGGQRMPTAVNDIFADPGNDVFALNADGSMLAVSFSDGGLTVFDLESSSDDLIMYDTSDYISFSGGFCGKYFAFTANKSAESQFGLIDTAEGLFMDGYSSRGNLLLKADERGIYLADGNLLVRFYPDTLKEMELAYTDSRQITGFAVDDKYTLIADDDQSFSFYDSGANRMSLESCNENCDFIVLAGSHAVIGNRNEPVVRLLELESHGEAQLLSYDARYIHDEARISQDGRTVMLFSYQGFCIYNMDGRIVMQAALDDAEHIYDQQFVKDGENSWLEVIWYDGTIRCYSAADGSLITETAGKPPSKDLFEEFYTEKYRIASKLHAAPEVYDIASDKLVATLEEDAYLTYVTQVGKHMITEYISAAGERYGLLLNENFQVLAYLPGLCDVTDGRAVFDYGSGNLRQCRLYSLEELIALGEAIE